MENKNTGNNEMENKSAAEHNDENKPTADNKAAVSNHTENKSADVDNLDNDYNDGIVNDVAVNDVVVGDDMVNGLSCSFEGVTNTVNDNDWSAMEFGMESKMYSDDSILVSMSSVTRLHVRKSIYCISNLFVDVDQVSLSGSRNDIFKTIDTLPRTHFLVVAGGVTSVILHEKLYERVLVYLKKKYQQVILVPGEEEYIGCDGARSAVISKLEKICKKTSVHLLNKSNVVIDDVRFIGTTLWSLMDETTFNQHSAKKIFVDAIDYSVAFISHMQFINEELMKSLDNSEPIVIVTYHSPSAKLAHKAVLDDINAMSYRTSILHRLILKDVKYWFIGCEPETITFNYNNETQLVSNPANCFRSTIQRRFTSIIKEPFYV